MLSDLDFSIRRPNSFGCSASQNQHHHHHIPYQRISANDDRNAGKMETLK